MSGSTYASECRHWRHIALLKKCFTTRSSRCIDIGSTSRPFGLLCIAFEFFFCQHVGLSYLRTVMLCNRTINGTGFNETLHFFHGRHLLTFLMSLFTLRFFFCLVCFVPISNNKKITKREKKKHSLSALYHYNLLEIMK